MDAPRAHTVVKLTRIANRITRAELGRLIGKSAWYVSRLEHGGRYTLTPEIRARIAQALETPEDLLFPPGGGE